MNTESSPAHDIALRPMTVEDLEAAVALDTEISGTARRSYFEKRLAAALRNPAGHIQVAAIEGGAMTGFALARVLEGEFGQDRTSAVLEAITVAPERQRHGTGHALMAGIEDVMRHKGIAELRTQTRWNSHDMMGFLDARGFELAPLQIIDIPVDARVELEPEDG